MTVKDQVLQLPKEEKLSLMEALWEDLSRNEEELESPAWHGKVLEERERTLQEGKDRFVTLDDARTELRKRRKR